MRRIAPGVSVLPGIRERAAQIPTPPADFAMKVTAEIEEATRRALATLRDKDEPPAREGKVKPEKPRRCVVTKPARKPAARVAPAPNPEAGRHHLAGSCHRCGIDRESYTEGCVGCYQRRYNREKRGRRRVA